MKNYSYNTIYKTIINNNNNNNNTRPGTPTPRPGRELQPADLLVFTGVLKEIYSSMLLVLTNSCRPILFTDQQKNLLTVHKIHAIIKTVPNRDKVLYSCIWR